jgi:hypothetical protein
MLLPERRALHTRRSRSDKDLFALQREMPARLSGVACQNSHGIGS